MRNIEALRNYFLGKDPQLEVVLSDNSLRLSGIEGKHYILRGELIKRLTDLKTAMEEADETIQGEIDDLNLWKDTTPFVLDSDLTAALSNYYTKTQVDNLLSVIPRFSIEVVAQLPTQDISTTTIYLAPSEDPQTANAYDEFIYVNNSWEQIGSTAIDMSDYYTKEEVNAKTFINTLTQDITIPETSELNPLLLSTGWWYTGEHVIYYGESVEPTIHNNALFYFNAEAGDQWFYFLPPNLDDGWNQLGTYLWFDSTDHIWQYSGYGVVTTIDNHSTDMSIPTAAAVHDFVINNGAGIKALTSPVTIWNLEDGVYLLPASCEVRYGGGTYWPASKALLFVGTENATTKRYFIFDGTGTQNTITNGSATETSGTIKYFSVGLDYEVAANKTTTAPNAQSTDTQYPTSKAVYNALQNIHGLTFVDLTATASPYICNDPSDSNYLYSSTAQALNEKLEDGIYKATGILYISGIGGTPQTLPVDFGGTPYYLVVQDEKLAIPLLQTETSGYMPGYFQNGGYSVSEVETTAHKVTSISSSSTNTQYPSAKAVYDAIPNITYGTTDLTPGVSPLSEGEFYFVYE